MNDLIVTTIQSNLEWEEKAANLSHFSDLIDQIHIDTDLIVLPEMFSTGFSMNVEALAEPSQGNTLQWLRAKAKAKNAVICGSFIVSESTQFFNRFIWMRPDGTYDAYDKRHLFTMGGEDRYFSPGHKKGIFELKGWVINAQICYDLRFPAWSRNVEGYDLYLNVANWPEKRSYHWKQLLIARAIENLSYVVGVNRIGYDGNGHYHSGDTSVIDMIGNVIYQTAHMEDIFTVRLNKNKLQATREKLNFLEDRDTFVFID